MVNDIALIMLWGLFGWKIALILQFSVHIDVATEFEGQRATILNTI